MENINWGELPESLREFKVRDRGLEHWGGTQEVNSLILLFLVFVKYSNISEVLCRWILLLEWIATLPEVDPERINMAIWIQRFVTRHRTFIT